MSNQAVELTEIRPYEGSDTLMAYVDVKIGDVLIHGAKIMKNDNSDLWAAFPSTEKDGKYFDVVSIDSRTLERKIKAEILRQYRQKARTTDAFGDAAPDQPFGFTEGDPLQ